MNRMIEQNKQVLLHLSLIYGVGPAAALKIVKQLFLELHPELPHVGLMELVEQQEILDLAKIYHYSISDFIRRVGLTEKLAKQLVDGLKDSAILDQELERINRFSVEVVTFLDHAYPEILKQIHFPPIILYCKGDPINMPSKRIAIVGSRKASEYAGQTIKNMVPQLVANGWQIVSGGALGADTMAHEATIDAGGKTIAVLGSGLMHPYPDSNKELFRAIARNGGTLVSPFPLNASPQKENFPARNRIIAGLSEGCLIVQAAEKSGALITAQFALEQGRHVFAVPGSIYEDLSAGCHVLIKQGAKLVNTINDIFEEFGEEHSQSILINAVHTKSLDQKAHAHSRFEKLPEKIAGKIPGQEVSIQPAVQEVEEIDPILKVLADTCTLDELSNKTGFELIELHNKLFDLQLEGKVRQTFAGAWERVL